MRITAVGAGTFVVAVSGGVDSMVLLDLLRKRPRVNLIVAHYDHGIRADSSKDRKLVQDIAKKHGLTFVYEEGKLGPNASEAAARTARYKYLEKVRKASNAKAIITAHHQDDAIETAILNILRGTGRRGLTALKSTEKLLRPLLGFDKDQIKEYARIHSIIWQEDPTNSDVKYTRNYIRSQILPKFSAGQKAQLILLLEQLAETNAEIDHNLIGMLHVQPALNKIDRKWFVHLPHDVAREVVHTWLGRQKVKDISQKTIERLVVAMKTGKIGATIDVNGTSKLKIGKDSLTLNS